MGQTIKVIGGGPLVGRVYYADFYRLDPYTLWPTIPKRGPRPDVDGQYEEIELPKILWLNMGERLFPSTFWHWDKVIPFCVETGYLFTRCMVSPIAQLDLLRASMRDIAVMGIK